MKKVFILFCSLSLIYMGCKSESKEASDETAADTTAVAAPPPVQTVDSAAITAQYQAAHAKVKATNQNSHKAHGSKKAKVDSDPVLPHHDVTEAAATDAAAAATPQVDGDGYYYSPSKWATFPGGEAALDKYLADNLHYPAAALDNGIEGTVYANLLVDNAGNIVDVVIVSKKIGFGLENEVIRVIKSMPRWNPGEYNAQPVKTKFTLPVVFDLL